MKILTLSEAEKLKDVLIPGEGYDKSIERAQWLWWVRLLYKKGFSICTGENLLYNTTRELIDDLIENTHES